MKYSTHNTYFVFVSVCVTLCLCNWVELHICVYATFGTKLRAEGVFF